MTVQKQKTTESAAESPARCEVFFDGSCPLCRAEISLYRKSGSDVQFTDISPDEAAPPQEITKAEAMGRFHVRRSDGRLVSGAAAFAELWKATPGWRWLGHVTALPPFVWIAEGAYRLFLLVRPAVQKAVRRAV
jgi:predicted DCC family thiol-disulfide oxidoreductase YuxK